jgi:hypothetical protein
MVQIACIGISDKFINNIKSIYRNAKAVVRNAKGQSNSFPIFNYVFQGETLSPKLFTIFIEDIIKVLNDSNLTTIKIGEGEINILLYADDMVVLAYNAIDLQEKIYILEKYFKDNDLCININKTKVVIFRQGNRKIKSPKIFWGPNEIEVVDKYVYLGVPFYGNMSTHNTTTDFVLKGKVAVKGLFDLYFKAGLNCLGPRLTLFDSLIKSVVLYCSHIWGVSSLDKLISFQFSFLKQLFRMPQHTPHWFLMLETQA